MFILIFYLSGIYNTTTSLMLNEFMYNLLWIAISISVKENIVKKLAHIMHVFKLAVGMRVALALSIEYILYSTLNENTYLQFSSKLVDFGH